MGKRGPAPQPSIVKYVRGNPSKERLNESEPTPDLVSEHEEPPEVLTGKAADIWREVAPRFSRMRVLTEADIPTLTRYCIETSLYYSCYEKVKTAGEEYIHWEEDPTSKGKMRIKYTQVAPWATQMNRHHAEMLKIEKEFGATPSSRSQVSTGANQVDDPLRSFAKKRSG